MTPSTAGPSAELGSYSLLPLTVLDSRVQVFYDQAEVGPLPFTATELALRYDGPIPAVGVPGPFTIAPGVIVPPGTYSYDTTQLFYVLGQQRQVSGRISASTGTLYGGTRSTLAYNGRWGVLPRFSIEPTISLNWVRLPYGDFNANLLSTRFTVTPSARMLISSLVQWNVDGKNLSSSLRLRWEYTGGSELFVVYSDGRDTGVSGFPGLLNRTFAVKVTRLFRF